MVQFRCASQHTAGVYYSISVSREGVAQCQCGGFLSGFCSHIDATLVANERFMVHPEDRAAADKAKALVGDGPREPDGWKASWRTRAGWRGLAQPQGDRMGALKAQYGEGYADAPKVCFTGNGGLKRSQLMEDARAKGWRAVDSFQKDLRVLVAENPKLNVSKLKGARSHNIPIISYEDWALLNADGEFTVVPAVASIGAEGHAS